MTKKITINGKEYGFEGTPEDMNKNVFTSGSISAGGKTYKNFNDLPPEIKVKIQEGLKGIRNVPFAKGILKAFGLDINNLQNMQLNPGSGSLKNSMGGSPAGDSPFKSSIGGSNPFGGQHGGNGPLGGGFSGGNNPFQQQFNNPMFNGKKSGAGWIVGCVIGILGLGGFIWLMTFGLANLGSNWEESFDLQGDPKHFDPIATVNEMRSHFDPNARLSSIDISYVKSDGTLDLTVTSYRPSARYQFYRELPEPPKDAPPVGAGGTKDGKWYEPVDVEVYEPGQWRHVKRIGGGVSTEYSYIHKGIDVDRGTPTTSPDDFVEDPKCSLADLWKTAIQKGAPADAVASVDYDDSGYDFRISDAGINLEFGFDCKLKEEL